MRKLQNNYTTQEQSKILLELGVPEWTADFFYPTKKSDMPIIIVDIKVGYNLKYAIPCWSVGRLIEIYCLCVDEMYSVEFIGQIHTRPMNKILDMLGYVKLDFSKLKEG